MNRLHEDNRKLLQVLQDFRSELTPLVSIATRYMEQYSTNNGKGRKRRKLQYGEADSAIFAVQDFIKVSIVFEMVDKLKGELIYPITPLGSDYSTTVL